MGRSDVPGQDSETLGDPLVNAERAYAAQKQRIADLATAQRYADIPAEQRILQALRYALRTEIWQAAKIGRRR